MIYIGNTQQNLKERMNQHAQDVRVLVNTGKTSDSFARHFAKHFGPAEKATVAKARELVKVEVEWQGNPISIMRSFGKLNCGLCMKERIKILHLSRNDPGKLINSNSEIYGACRHKTKFHRYYTNLQTSTDEAVIAEKAFMTKTGGRTDLICPEVTVGHVVGA